MALSRTSRRLVIAAAAVVVLAVLLVIAFFVGERMARETATSRIQSELATAFQLEADHPMDIDLGEGFILPQAAAGALETVDVGIDDVALGGITGSVAFSATDVPLDAGEPLGSVTATATVDEDTVSALGDSLSGVELESVTLDDDTIVATSVLSAFGFDVPVSVALAPSVSGGAIAFEPVSFSLNDATVSLQELRDGRFGRFVEALLPQQQFCVAEYLPVSIVLETATVSGGELVLGFVGDGVVLDELGTTGGCS